MIISLIKKGKNMAFLMKPLLCIVGGAVFINGFAVMLLSNFNFGHIFTCILGAVLFLWGMFYRVIRLAVPRFLRITVATLLAAIMILSAFLIISGRSDSADFTEDAVIVLGAGVHGETPSLTLKKRLDTAVDYYNKNPDAVIVVSGGQGPQEKITEALAMERYLVERGIPRERILKEERATSTRENFTFSKEILDSYFDGEYSVAFITDDYHVYRASRYAASAGFGDMRYYHCKVKWYMVLPSCLRESAAVVGMWLNIDGK